MDGRAILAARHSISHQERTPRGPSMFSLPIRCEKFGESVVGAERVSGATAGRTAGLVRASGSRRLCLGTGLPSMLRVPWYGRVPPKVLKEMATTAQSEDNLNGAEKLQRMRVMDWKERCGHVRFPKPRRGVYQARVSSDLSHEVSCVRATAVGRGFLYGPVGESAGNRNCDRHPA
jgi:hypothetical protein